MARMVASVLVLALAAFARAQEPVPVNFRLCGSGSMNVVGVALSPYPASADTNLTFLMTTSTGVSITSDTAVAELEVRLLGVSLPIPGGSQYDLCKWIEGTDSPLAQECPTRPGVLPFSATFEAACTAPEGTYSIKMNANSATNGPLFCVETDIFVAGAECPTSRRAPMPHAPRRGGRLLAN